MSFRRSLCPKGHHIDIRVTEDEKSAVQARAKEHQLSVSDYMLRTALGKPTVNRMGANNVVTLINVARTVREIRAAQPLVIDDELREILNEVVSAIQRIGRIGL